MSATSTVARAHHQWADRPPGRGTALVTRALRRRDTQLLLAMLAVGGASSALHPGFASSSNISFMLADSVITMVLAVGQTIVVIGRGIDLSVAPVLGIAAVGAGFPAQDHNLNIFVALVLVLLIGTGLGMGNGVLVAVAGVPPIIATLATLTIYGGLQFIITSGNEVVSVPSTYEALGSNALLPDVPWLILVGAAVVLSAHCFLTRTTTGRAVFAVGSNASAAFRAGIPVRRTIFLTYVLSGMLAGLAGLVYLCHTGSADATTGTDTNVNLTSIAATLIGGTTLLGGRGRPLGSALGAVFLSVALTAMVFARVPPIWEPAGVGVLILLAVVTERPGAPARRGASSSTAPGRRP
jgi:ribose/xylose/arabinose/galactoside ABC-type transport system permease subunit